MPNRFVKFEANEQALAQRYKETGDAWFQGITQGAATTPELEGILGLLNVGSDGRYYPVYAGPPYTYDGENALDEPLWSQTQRGSREIVNNWPRIEEE